MARERVKRSLGEQKRLGDAQFSTAARIRPKIKFLANKSRDEDTLAFFKSLHDKGVISTLNVNDFEAYFIRATAGQWKPEDINTILRGTARVMPIMGKSNEKRDACRAIVLEHFGKLEANIESILHNFKNTDYYTHAKNCAKLKIRPSERFLDHFFTACADKIKKISPAKMSSFMRSMAKLGILPPARILNQVLSKLDVNIGKLRHTTASTVMWSAAAIDSMPGSDEHGLLKAIYTKLRRKYPQAHYKGIDTRQRLHSADLWFRNATPVRNISTKDTTSNMEEDMMAYFDLAGYTVLDDTDGIIADIPNAIDFAIQVPSTSETVMIEMDGPSHYINVIHNDGSYGEDYNGNTILQAGLSQKSGQNLIILRISIDLYRRLQAIEQETDAAGFRDTVKPFLDTIINTVLSDDFREGVHTVVMQPDTDDFCISTMHSSDTKPPTCPQIIPSAATP